MNIAIKAGMALLTASPASFSAQALTRCYDYGAWHQPNSQAAVAQNS